MNKGFRGVPGSETWTFTKTTLSRDVKPGTSFGLNGERFINPLDQKIMMHNKTYKDSNVTMTAGHLYKNTKTGVIASYVGINKVPVKEVGFAQWGCTTDVHTFQDMKDGSTFIDNELGDWVRAGDIK